MSYQFLDIANSLKAYREDRENYQAWLKQVLESDALNAIVEHYDVSSPGTSGSLSGLPVLIKDNLCLKGSVAACGSQYLKNHRVPYTATVVERLLQAGCHLKGRTNMDEFAMGSSTEYSSFGPTQNPWNLDKVPGGSSGGSAAAVAAGWVPVALGSDTGGSVRQPAAFCGVVGYKPTYGFLSRFGLVAFASSFDQVGVFAHKVSDVATLMEVMSGHDASDSTSLPIDSSWKLKDLDFKNLRVGILSEDHLEGIQAEIRESFEQTVQYFKSEGAHVSTVALPNLDKGLPAYYIMALAEASANLARYDGVRYGHRSSKVKNVNDIFKLSRSESLGLEVKRRILLGVHVLSSGYFDAYYNQARKMQRQIQREHERVFEGVDVLITPTTRQTAFGLGEKSLDPVEMYKSDGFTVCANHAGLPALSVPSGLDQSGLPIGLQFVGSFGKDQQLLSLARQWQKAHPFEMRPEHV